MTRGLELPRLSLATCGSGVRFYTDDTLFCETGVRIGFTERGGGFSEESYGSLNLGRFAGEGEEAAMRNIAHLMEQVGAAGAHLLNPKQVHGTDLVTIDSERDVRSAQMSAEEGADGILVNTPDVFTLLCFADCVPLIMVSPEGAFSVVHAGWRGTYGRIASKALHALADLICQQYGQDHGSAVRSINIYIGPHIHSECFEVGADTFALFEDEFGEAALVRSDHVDLAGALRLDLLGEGADPDRIVDVDICTVCNVDAFFSYRACSGVCGRHGAFAFRSRQSSPGCFSSVSPLNEGVDIHDHS